MSVVRECAGCGHPNTGDAMFCSKCGSKLPAPAATPASTSEPGAKAGESAAAPEPSAAPPDEAPSEPEVPAASGTPEPSRRPARRVAGAARTMLGMPAPGVDDAVAAARASVEAKKPEGEAPETPADAPGKHAPATKGAPPKRIPGTARTMLGMPAPDRAEIQEAVDAAKARTEAEASPTAPAGPDVAATVAGVGAPPAAPAAPDAAKPE
ncbi:MAG TPA: hypothetical protein RMH99_00300, partial [Sandaracinaceae bacterium LLY-WYZ-13_1]|nr:hypothetical protein [Sandaracinaceae bacterium LLY-WYZ-13_1]